MNFEPLGCAFIGFVSAGVFGWYVDVPGPDADAFLWLETAVVNACHQDFSLLDVDFAGPGCKVAILSRVTSPIPTYSILFLQRGC